MRWRGNFGGTALLLFAGAFLWITPAFASKGVSTEGVMWALSRILAVTTLIGLLAATWGLFRQHGWWETVAVGSAVLGLVAALVYWVAAARAGETTPWYTALLLTIGCAGVLVLLKVPFLERWVDRHVMGG